MTRDMKLADEPVERLSNAEEAQIIAVASRLALISPTLKKVHDQIVCALDDVRGLVDDRNSFAAFSEIGELERLVLILDAGPLLGDSLSVTKSKRGLRSVIMADRGKSDEA